MPMLFYWLTQLLFIVDDTIRIFILGTWVKTSISKVAIPTNKVAIACFKSRSSRFNYFFSM